MQLETVIYGVPDITGECYVQKLPKLVNGDSFKCWFVLPDIMSRIYGEKYRSDKNFIGNRISNWRDKLQDFAGENGGEHLRASHTSLKALGKQSPGYKASSEELTESLNEMEFSASAAGVLLLLTLFDKNRRNFENLKVDAEGKLVSQEPKCGRL